MRSRRSSAAGAAAVQVEAITEAEAVQGDVRYELRTPPCDQVKRRAPRANAAPRWTCVQIGEGLFV